MRAVRRTYLQRSERFAQVGEEVDPTFPLVHLHVCYSLGSLCRIFHGSLVPLLL